MAFLYLILSSFFIFLSCPFFYTFFKSTLSFSTLHPAPPIISILSAPVFDGAFTVFQILFFKLLCSFCPGCEEDPVHADAECTILARGPRPHFRRGKEDFGGKNREEEKADESDASATAASDASATAYHAILPLRLLLLQDRKRREHISK